MKFAVANPLLLVNAYVLPPLLIFPKDALLEVMVMFCPDVAITLLLASLKLAVKLTAEPLLTTLCEDGVKVTLTGSTVNTWVAVAYVKEPFSSVAVRVTVPAVDLLRLKYTTLSPACPTAIVPVLEGVIVVSPFVDEACNITWFKLPDTLFP